MQKAIKVVASVLFVVAAMLPLAPAGAAPPASESQLYTFTTYDAPGSSLTQIYGINPGGDFVGTYQGTTDKQSTVWPMLGKQSHGFVVKNGEFSSFDYPNLPGKVTDYTAATGISPDGDIVGYYASEGEPLTTAYGFLYSKHGEWSTYPTPSALKSQGEPTMRPTPMRVLPDGRTVG